VSVLASDLGIDSLSVVNVGAATSSLNAIDDAIDAVSSARGSFGALQNRLESTVRNISVQSENLIAAESRIRDVDVARETAELAKNTILQQAAIAVLVQANQMPQLALKLLGA
jgi:flagellin